MTHRQPTVPAARWGIGEGRRRRFHNIAVTDPPRLTEDGVFTVENLHSIWPTSGTIDNPRFYGEEIMFNLSSTIGGLDVQVNFEDDVLFGIGRQGSLLFSGVGAFALLLGTYYYDELRWAVIAASGVS